MKLRICLFFLAYVVFAEMADAQQTIVKGTVTLSNAKLTEPIPISVLNARDSLLMHTFLTDASGSFEFSVEHGDSFVVAILNPGYNSYLSQSITQTKSGMLELGNIQLVKTDEIQLAQVSIIGLNRFVEVKADRTVVNPDALATTAGLTALDVLQKSPGVIISNESTIALKGKNGVMVLIDDRKVYMQQGDLISYLKSIPSSSIQSIEIMTNPPSKYDAEGNAGIINIKLKKTTLRGSNGSISMGYGQGFYHRSNNSISINYREGKFNFFINAAYTMNNSFQDLTIKRKYLLESGLINSTFTQQTLIKMKSKTASAKAGFDFYLTSKSTIGFSCNGFNTYQNSTVNNTALVTDGNYQLLNMTHAYKPSRRKWYNTAYNINYSFKPDTLGNELTLSGDYVTYNSKINQSLISDTYLPDNTFQGQYTLLSQLPALVTIKTAKTDFIHPVNSFLKTEAGIKTSFVKTKNRATFYDLIEEQKIINNDFTNNFNFDESIYASYLNTTIQKANYSTQAGLRFEHTSYVGCQYGNNLKKDSLFNKTYSKLFPTFYFSYFPDSAGIHQLNFSAGRRIERPNYQDMNPFTYPLDRFTLYSGNPFLQPTISWNFELSHVFQGKYTTAFSYSKINNVITETVEQDTNTFFSRPGNIGRQKSYGLSFNGTFSPFKWLHIICYTELVYNEYKSIIYNQKMNNNGWYWYAGPTLQFKFTDKWSAELNGSYQTSVLSSQFVLSPIGIVNGAIVKKIIKKKATFKINISDMFYSNQVTGEIRNLYNSQASWNSYFDTRVITVSFSYRFSKGQSSQVRQRNSSETEQKRIK
jgi:hypothetical protein